MHQFASHYNIAIIAIYCIYFSTSSTLNPCDLIMQSFPLPKRRVNDGIVSNLCRSKPLNCVRCECLLHLQLNQHITSYNYKWLKCAHRVCQTACTYKVTHTYHTQSQEIQRYQESKPFYGEPSTFFLNLAIFMVDITNRGPIFGAISCRVPGIRTEWLPWNCLATAPAAWDLGWLVIQPWLGALFSCQPWGIPDGWWNIPG